MFFMLGLLVLLSSFSRICNASALQTLQKLNWPLQNISVRARFAEQTFLGNDAPEKFNAYDFSSNFKMPYTLYANRSWELGSNLMFSVGVLEGLDKSALVASAVPELMLRRSDGRVTVNAGFGFAAFSRHKLALQDFGGPLQFTLTFGSTVELARHIRVGYRFQHYSDARAYGRDTTGADLHMLELYYQF